MTLSGREWFEFSHSFYSSEVPMSTWSGTKHFIRLSSDGAVWNVTKLQLGCSDAPYLASLKVWTNSGCANAA